MMKVDGASRNGISESRALLDEERKERKGESENGNGDESENGEGNGDDHDGPDLKHNDGDEQFDGGAKEPKQVYKLSLRKTRDFTETLLKRGVVYISRVPPRMNPTKLKTLLSEFGEVTRVYLVEEDATVRKRRRKSGGSGAKRYVEGWIEFGKKKVAKHVASSLNNTPISMHKRNVHFGDLWNLKYLKRFQWAHLTEKVAYERRVREQKLRVEMMQAKKENAAYQELVETGKKLDKIEERKRKRGESFVSAVRERNPKQKKPMKEGTDRSTKKALLSSLV